MGPPRSMEKCPFEAIEHGHQSSLIGKAVGTGSRSELHHVGAPDHLWIDKPHWFLWMSEMFVQIDLQI